MKKSSKLMALLMTIIMALSMSGCAAARTRNPIDTSTEMGKAIEVSGDYLYKKMSNSPKFGKERAIIGLLGSDYMTYWDDRAMNYVENMKTMIQRGGSKIAEKRTIYFDRYPIVFLTHTACGIYADKTASADLTQGITIDAIVLMGGYDNKINCLTALECAGQGVYGYYNSETQKADLSRESLVEFILSLQKADGSFTYTGMEEQGFNAIKVTSDAVIALASTKQDATIEKAVKAGADYLAKSVKPEGDFNDICNAVIALNYAGIDATDVNGNDLIKGLIIRQYSDGTFSRDTTDKKGNFDDTASALLAFASQYRFEKGLKPLYDFSDAYGKAHNKLSPLWTMYANLMKFRLGGIISFLIFLYVRSRYRIRKWRKEGVYNERASRMYTDAELEEIRAKKELEEQARAEKIAEMNAQYENDTEEEPTESSEFDEEIAESSETESNIFEGEEKTEE